jgi:adenylate kinase family enzyme
MRSARHFTGMKRILVIGPSGAGKSTLAVKLGERLGLPVHHLDRLFWQAGWVETDKSEWRRKQAAVAERAEWIIDGTYDSTLEMRLPRADTVVLLDFPRTVCMRRSLWRIFSGWGRQRPDTGDGCPERWDWSFIKWVWRYQQDVMPRVHRLLAEHGSGLHLITLRTPREVSRWLASVMEATPD